MQPTKDTFYVALRDALAALYPARTINFAGQERPAILVPENEVRSSLVPPAPFEQPAPGSPAFGSLTRVANCFYLQFGAAAEAEQQSPGAPPLMAMQCLVTYATTGTPNSTGADRGRMLAELDAELLAIVAAAGQGGFAPKLDYTQTPPAPLGGNITWTRPAFANVQSLSTELRRSAAITVFFYPEQA